MKIKIFFLILMFLIAMTAEGGSLMALKALEAKGLVYEPLRTSRSKYEDYLKLRHPVLGWPSPEEFGKKDGRWDAGGAYRSPTYSHFLGQEDDIAVYGDSFTKGSEVAPDASYPAVLSRRLSRKVSNYGVGGYGTDQAYLRFLINQNDKSRYVILGLSTENVLRNINRYRNFLYPVYGSMPFGLKPRFVLNSQDELTLIDMPHLDFDGFQAMITLARPIENEYFRPGGPAGAYPLRFPYTLCLLKTLLHNEQIHSELEREPRHMRFYSTGHPSKALPVTLGILKAFRDRALEDGKHPLILIIPNGSDFEFHKRTGQWAYAGLLPLLRDQNIEYIDAGPLMMKKLGSRDFSVLFKNIHMHYNKEGYALLADVVNDHFINMHYDAQIPDNSGGRNGQKYVLLP